MPDSAKIIQAPAEYSRDLEQYFRRDLERLISQVLYDIENLSVGRTKNGSLYSKKESLTIPALGITSY